MKEKSRQIKFAFQQKGNQDVCRVRSSLYIHPVLSQPSHFITCREALIQTDVRAFTHTEQTRQKLFTVNKNTYMDIFSFRSHDLRFKQD